MHLRLTFLTAIAALAIASSASAQMATVKLTAEDTHTIKEVVLKETKVPKVAAGDYKVGDQAPAGAELQPFPSLIADKISAIKSHRFFVSGEKIFVVDPKDNKIAEVIE